MTSASGFARDVRDAARGDTAAWQRMYVRFGPVLARIAQEFRRTETPELSTTDLTQEAWLHVFQVLPQFTGSAVDRELEQMFQQWLRQCARNRMLNIMAARRTQRRNPRMPLRRLDTADGCGGGLGVPADDGSPSSIHTAKEAHDQVRAAVESILDPVDRQIIEGSFFQGESLHKISERLQLPYDAVRERFHRTLRFLQDRLEH